MFVIAKILTFSLCPGKVVLDLYSFVVDMSKSKENNGITDLYGLGK